MKTQLKVSKFEKRLSDMAEDIVELLEDSEIIGECYDDLLTIDSRFDDLYASYRRFLISYSRRDVKPIPNSVEKVLERAKEMIKEWKGEL